MALVQPSSERKAVRIFCSYSHQDEALRQKLETHLAAMRRGGLIESWSDRKIVPGTAWQEEIKKELEGADIVLLLVSSTFINSDFCVSVELEQALSRHEKGEVLVIPIALRPCDWLDTPIAGLQALPTDARPVTTWQDRDKAFLDVTKGIRAAIEGLNQWRAKASRSDSIPSSSSIESGVKAQEGSSRQVLSSASLTKPPEPHRIMLESLFGEEERFASPEWMLRGLEQARAVARIERRNGAHGTGVLVSHDDFPWAPADTPLLLTCQHIVSGPDSMTVLPEDSVAFFELLDVRLELGEVLWSSSYLQLDAAIFSLAKPVNAQPCRVAPHGSYGERSQVFLIGHPRGRDLSFSLWNSWIAGNETFLHYRAAVQPGSGGSPVFDQEWNMIAIHHKRSNEMKRLDGQPGTYEACEGISAHAIKQAAALGAR